MNLPLQRGPVRSHDNFDFLRLLAAGLVLYSHQHALLGLPEPGFIGYTFGALGVLIFFVISGFLVAGSWLEDPSLWRFTARRLLRIWPGLAVMVLLMAWVLGPAMSSAPWQTYRQDPRVAQYLQNLYFDVQFRLPFEFTGNVIPDIVNGSIWTIPLELACYLLLAVLGVTRLLRLRWPVALMALALAAHTYGYQLQGELTKAWLPAGDWIHLLTFGLHFLAGVCLRLYWQRVSARRWPLALAAWLLVLPVTLFLGRPLLGLWIALPLAILAFGTASFPVVRACGRFGDLSYGIYIYAYPVQQLVFHQAKGRLSFGVMLLITVMLTSAAAWLSWHLVERHALKLKPKRARPAPGMVQATSEPAAMPPPTSESADSAARTA